MAEMRAKDLHYVKQFENFYIVFKVNVSLSYSCFYDVLHNYSFSDVQIKFADLKEKTKASLCKCKRCKQYDSMCFFTDTSYNFRIFHDIFDILARERPF